MFSKKMNEKEYCKEMIEITTENLDINKFIDTLTIEDFDDKNKDKRTQYIKMIKNKEFWIKVIQKYMTIAPETGLDYAKSYEDYFKMKLGSLKEIVTGLEKLCNVKVPLIVSISDALSDRNEKSIVRERMRLEIAFPLIQGIITNGFDVQLKSLLNFCSKYHLFNFNFNLLIQYIIDNNSISCFDVLTKFMDGNKIKLNLRIYKGLHINTLLHEAVRKNCIPVVLYLLKQEDTKDLVNAIDCHEKTALDYATENCYHEMVQLLLNAGAEKISIRYLKENYILISKSHLKINPISHEQSEEKFQTSTLFQ